MLAIRQNGGVSRPTESPNLLIFATGGTIGMHDTDKGLAPDPEFPAALEALLARICAPLGVRFRVNYLNPAIDSSNADVDTAPRIARAVRARVRTQAATGVVVLHGTDTLAFTASRLAFDLADLGIPVLLTGSQLPHGAPGTDALANLTLAIRAVVRASRTAPVTVAFGDALVPAVRATKHSSVARGAFRAELDLARDPAGLPPEPTEIPARAQAARVITFRFTPAVTADDLRAAVGGGPDGLVLECYGAGNGPTARPGMLLALREVCDAMPVVAVSQCSSGGVSLGRYSTGHDLASVGVIDGSDMTVEAATAKLGYLIDRGHSGEALRTHMRHNLVGECR